MDVSREEIDRLYTTLDDGFASLHQKLDRINGNVNAHDSRLAVIEDRGHPATWGGGIAGALVGLAEAVRWMLGLGK